METYSLEMNVFNTLAKIKYDEELADTKKAEEAKKNGEHYVSKREIELVGSALTEEL